MHSVYEDYVLSSYTSFRLKDHLSMVNICRDLRAYLKMFIWLPPSAFVRNYPWWLGLPSIYLCRYSLEVELSFKAQIEIVEYGRFLCC